MKLFKPAHIYLAFCCFVLLIGAKFFLTHLWSSRSKSVSVVKSILPPDDVNDFNTLQKSLLVDEPGGPDPFIKGDYLNKKFLHLVSLTHFSAEPVSSLDQNATRPIISDFSYLLNELKIVVNVKNFYARLLGCKEISSVQVKDILYETQHRVLYHGLYKTKDITVEVVKANIDELMSAKCGSSDSDLSQANLDRCFLLKNRRILDEAALLMQLPHKSIARILGLCVQHGNSKENFNDKISSAGVVLLKETGRTAHIETLKVLNWEERLMISMELLNLVVYFSQSPMGSICLENWSPENFILNSETNKIQLYIFDQFFSFSEPSCSKDSDCFVDGINCGVTCIAQQCKGYNAKRNLFELHQSILSPLLRYNSPTEISDKIQNLLASLNNLQSSASDVAHSLWELSPKLEPEEQQNLVANKDKSDNPAVLSMQKLPDGSQVDSWEQHEDKFAINEVNPDSTRKPDANQDALPDDSPIETELRGFRKIENADYPGRYDYYCPGSKAEWGCVMSLHTASEAINFCLKDDKCKAFITIPHLRKEGWLIVIMKSDNSNPVDHAGTTVYVRPHSDGVQLPLMLPQDDTMEANKQGDCLKDVMKEQTKLRESLEGSLMKSCGWTSMTDDLWTTEVKKAKISNANSFKPARGKLANGGQMDIIVDFDSRSYPAVFLAKKGPEEFDVSQSAVYQLDRMLGLYKTVPAVERLLTASELADAGFPVDIGGNQFDKFRSLKQSDGSLLGVIVPKIKERVSIEHYISVPRLSGITNAVTPFNKKQWDDLEYLLLGFLASIPLSSKGHQGVKGRLLHLKNEEAFLHQTNGYNSYFYNCQFPAHVINVLRHSESRRCDFGSAIRTRLLDNASPPISKVLQTNVKRLLELVDQCVTRFGKQVVLYDTVATARRR